MPGVNRLAGVIMLLTTVCLSAAAAEIQWQPQDFPAAMRKASAEEKLIYIFVEGDNCPPCDAFKASHLADPAFIDFVNAVYVPIRAHESDPAGRAFLESLRLVHAAVPRFYVLGADGSPVSMSIGMVMAPPMGAAEVLKLAPGNELSVNKARAAELAGRLRAHAASQRASGAVHADNPLRYLGVAILEAQAWALAGRLDEAERSFGREWASQLIDQEIRYWYVNFWINWNRNHAGALEAAEAYLNTTPEDPVGLYLTGRALAANGRFDEAVRAGEAYLAADPENARVTSDVEKWRRGVLR